MRAGNEAGLPRGEDRGRGYIVRKPLVVPEIEFTKPLSPHSCRIFGIEYSTDTPPTGLVRVELSAGNDDGKWGLDAFKFPGLLEEDIYGSIFFAGDTPKPDVLAVAARWINDSEGLELAIKNPLAVVKPEAAANTVRGTVLVRKAENQDRKGAIEKILGIFGVRKS